MQYYKHNDAAKAVEPTHFRRISTQYQVATSTNYILIIYLLITKSEKLGSQNYSSLTSA